VTRDDEDAAVVVTILTAIARSAAAVSPEPVRPQSFWGSPAFRIADAAPGPRSWWASGLPR
jgi:hypothetical protein